MLYIPDAWPARVEHYDSKSNKGMKNLEAGHFFDVKRKRFSYQRDVHAQNAPMRERTALYPRQRMGALNPLTGGSTMGMSGPQKVR